MSQRLMYSPILRSIAQVLLLNHLPSQDLGIRRYNKKREEDFFPGKSLKENLLGAFCKLCKKKVKDLFENWWWGLDYQTIYKLEG